MTAIMFVDPTTAPASAPSSGGGGGSTNVSGVVTIAGATSTLGVTLANVSSATPLPVAFGSGGSVMDVSIVSASNGTPINVTMPGITTGNPLPVSFPTTGGMNVTVTNGSPIPVSFSTAGGMGVNVLNASLPVTVSGTPTVNATITNVTSANALPVTVSGTPTVNAVISNVTTATPLPVSFNTAGGMDVNILNTSVPVTLAGLISGEDQAKNWLRTADGATQGYQLNPYGSGAAGDVTAETVLGASGASGDYLKSLTYNVRNATAAAAFVLQDGQVLGTVGTSGTAPTGTTTISVVATAAITLLQNQFSGRIIMITYTPTGASGTVKLRRRITSHAAFASATSLSFTVTHAVPAGGAISAWQVEGPDCYEILPYNTPVGMYQIKLGEVSTTGAWRIAVDSGVSCHAIGKFT